MIRPLACVLVALLAPLSATALTVEAEGVVPIYNRDLESARQAAVKRAAEQAVLQAGARVSSSQRIVNGILVEDRIRLSGQGELESIRVLEERVEGDRLRVRIRAEVATETSCAVSSDADRFRKRLAVAGFRLQNPQQATLGGFVEAGPRLAEALAARLRDDQRFETLNASNLDLLAAGSPTRSEDTGTLTTALPVFRELEAQFLVSGLIRDLSPLTDDRQDEGNVLKVWYDSLDPMGRQHLRNFAVDLHVHDGFTGALIFSRSYRVAGRWNLDAHERTGFLTPAFLATDYGQQVNRLLDQLKTDLTAALRCEPFTARILATDGNRITFNAGSVAGLRPGDILTVYRVATEFDPQNRPYRRLESTGQQLVVNEVHPLFATGNLPEPAERFNIQQDDLVMAR